MARCIFGNLLVVLLLTAGNSLGQASQSRTSQTTATQRRIVGEVTAGDKPPNQVTIKTDTGESITILTNEASSVLRLPAGETSAQKATKITLADIGAGDRPVARGAPGAGGGSFGG